VWKLPTEQKVYSVTEMMPLDEAGTITEVLPPPWETGRSVKQFSAALAGAVKV
jgi:hypothetical protein